MAYKELLETENFYGHYKRLAWMKSHTVKGEKVLEVGCGSGAYITTPLILCGRDAYGCDTGVLSIREASRIARENGITKERYFCKSIADVDEVYDTVICSEVLEHIPDSEQAEFIDQICRHVKPGGKLLITVPNGKGSYEIGQKYFKKPVEALEEFKQPYYRLRHNLKVFVLALIDRLKNRKIKKIGGVGNFSSVTGQFGGGENRETHLTFTDTPHVQWFSVNDILNLIMPRGFRLEEFTGSSMFCGVIINTYIRPNRLLCKINDILGSKFPKQASGYYFYFRKTG